MKKFIITIDTEGDNLWDWHQGDEIKTENVKYLERFQNLCNRYGFLPVWLSNYEMISDDAYVTFIKDVEKNNKGELGMHLHAWNSPPDYPLEGTTNAAPYLIEYPYDEMKRKINFLYNFIKERTGITPVSHRAGRWAMNDDYFNLLKEFGFKVDCSVTPGVDWSNSLGRTSGSKGTDYTDFPRTPYIIDENSGLIEIPVTIMYSKKFYMPERISCRRLASGLYKMIKGQNIWLRPTGKNLSQMIDLVDYVRKTDEKYIMFMLHSSEMMPGGSPTFKTKEDIEKMYEDVEKVFSYASRYFEGITLRDYYKETLEML